ncbi:T9SS type B sorting domain-containing protein [Mangrovimonas sp. CR14]|uniref:T9SS type B sorting domain-containing protein n=1 Tax=Mangrovimonas sp. CR14 TaxID=2706120 RepID=UPI00141DC57C|nr:T9SS type B sorting domain-containing protein [Mangrovimonas sp. CR14]NIK90998.1 T9SS type B sorting domain-containing protein [Mangrovimonas sp. CR14]
MQKVLKLNFFVLISFCWIFNINAQITLTHNSCEVVQTNIHSCTSSNIYWSRTFTLEEFGIDSDDEFIINKGQFAIVNTSWIPTGQFRIYAIDDDFPSSFSESNLIGESQEVDLPWNINDTPEIITIDFETPIMVPAGTLRILVEVKKGMGGIGSPSSVAFIAGSLEDNDLSWQRYCISNATPINGFVTATDMGYPNANFYINVTGSKNSTNDPFTLNFTNDCTNTLVEFHLNNENNINTVQWDFGDAPSSPNNNSDLISPQHDFSSPGQYAITATIQHTDGSTFVLNETISVAEPPIAYPIENLEGCESVSGSGISSNFDTSNVESQVTNGQTAVVVSYFDQNGNQLPSPLPNPFTNTQPNSQTITARVSNSSDLCCYTETSFNLTVIPIPNINQVEDIHACNTQIGGFSEFSLENIPNDLINGQTNLTVALYNSNNTLISPQDYTNFLNLTPYQDYVIALVTDTITNCSSEIIINLIINDNPVINQPQTIFGCDDNNDGISEYFDTTNLESEILNGQVGMTVDYFDENGIQLPSPLPNPITNSNPFNDIITIRVTNNNTTCFSETTLQLQTITQPNINQPNNLFGCDLGNGYSEFDTTDIQNQIIENQTGLTIQYFDSNFNPLPSPLPASFQNTEPYSQTIHIRVEDSSNPICFAETSFELIVNDLPEINLENEYLICDLEPSFSLTTNPNFNSFNWSYEDGTLMSDSYLAVLTEEGGYILTVTQFENGVLCENSFSFNVIRSELPEILQVNYGELGNNYIEIIASGDGNFEYSIDGVNYQESNYFSNLPGGTYEVSVRDQDGCGEDSKTVSIIDYPKFFTPNNDGDNDFWQIAGIRQFPNSKILIFDRYGKLLTQLSSNDIGWDGSYKDEKMATNDYWFRADLGNGHFFTGHFALKR